MLLLSRALSGTAAAAAAAAASASAAAVPGVGGPRSPPADCSGGTLLGREAGVPLRDAPEAGGLKDEPRRDTDGSARVRREEMEVGNMRDVWRTRTGGALRRTSRGSRMRSRTCRVGTHRCFATETPGCTVTPHHRTWRKAAMLPQTPASVARTVPLSLTWFVVSANSPVRGGLWAHGSL